jgi:replicative superfamily II helicase
MEEAPKFPLRQRQSEAIEAFLGGRGFLFVVPTGYGKTMAAIAAIKKTVTDGKNCIMLSSNKSLTREQLDTFNKWGINTEIDDGDNRKDKAFYDSRVPPLVVMTFERFESVVSNPSLREQLMDNCGLVVVDEVHNVGDPERGANLENALIMTKFLFPEVLICGLSATVGENSREKLASWLGAELIYAGKEERPVPLELHYANYEEVMFPWNDEIPDFKANYNKRIQITQQILRQHPGKKVIIFTTSRPRTESVVKDLKGIRRPMDIIEMVENYRVGYHNAGLSVDEKHYVEDAFRDGNLDVVASTPTLATGVNLPADVCIIFDTEQYSAVKGNEIIDANRLQQTIGRAGRPGLSTMGYAYIITPNRIYQEVKQRCENPLEVDSQIRKRLHEKVLRWIYSGAVCDELDLSEIITNSYGEIVASETEAAINWLTAFNFVYAEDDTYHCTNLGKTTAQLMVMPETVVEWIKQTQNLRSLTDVKELFLRFGNVPEYFETVVIRQEDTVKVDTGAWELGTQMPMDRVPRPYICHYCKSKYACLEKAKNLSACDNYKNEYDYNSYSVDESVLAMKKVTIPPELYKCFFITFAQELKEKYHLIQKKVVGNKTVTKDSIPISAGDLFLLKESGERMFSAASSIMWRNKLLSDTLATVAKLCSAGTFKPELVDLMKLKKIGLVRAKLLFAAGVKTSGQFLDEEPAKLGKIMKLSARVVTGIIRINSGEKVDLKESIRAGQSDDLLEEEFRDAIDGDEEKFLGPGTG